MRSEKAGTLLAEIFRRNWNEIFVYDSHGTRNYTYGEFFAAVLTLKSELEARGLRRGDTVFAVLPNSIELMALYFAALTGGITIAPVDPGKGRKELEEITAQLPSSPVICEGESRPLLKAARTIDVESVRKRVSDARPAGKEGLSIFETADCDAVFLITFTSGSTGVPKGVRHSFNNLYLSAAAFGKRFGFGKDNVFYHNLPMTYMAGVLNLIFLPFISESRIVIGERFGFRNIIDFWKTPIRYGANTFWFPPTVLALLLKLDRGGEGVEYASRTAITACVGTAPLGPRTRREFEAKYGIPLYESYGLSETLFVTTNCPKNDGGRAGVGELLDGVELRFMKDGEIAIKVPWMFLGYTNQESEPYFKDGMYLSGDIGRMEGDRLFITGRKKDLIKRGGVNVSPRKIEDFALSYGIFDECAVIGAPDAVLGEKTVCFFTPLSGAYAESKRKELGNSLIESLGRDYQVDEFVELTEIPKNIAGKQDKPRLREIYAGMRK